MQHLLSVLHILDGKITFDIQNYIDYIMYVNIIQTFDGHINEVQLVEYINKLYSPIFEFVLSFLTSSVLILYSSKRGFTLFK